MFVYILTIFLSSRPHSGQIMHLKFIILLFLVTILKEIIGEYTGSCADFIKDILTNIEVNGTSLIIGE